MSAVRRASSPGRAGAGVLLALGLAACQTPPSVPLPHQVLVRAHLADLIEKHGFTCASVVEYVRVQRLDYRALCDTGHAYQVWVGADGRVSVAGSTAFELRGSDSGGQNAAMP